MDVFALAGFAFVASITPGPNNVMLWSSGLNYGLRRTLPHLAGVNLGFASLTFLVATGLGTVMAEEPILSTTLKVLGSAYLLWLAWRIATTPTGEAAGSGEGVAADTPPTDTRPTDTPPTGARPLTFLQAAAFQYVNPKAWVMAVTAVALAVPADAGVLETAPLFTAVFWAVNLPCISVWAAAGTAIGRVLTDPVRLRWTNRTLGALLVATVFLLVR